MVSTLSNALDFFRDFGIFDVILPFLLVFTVVFAILQKTELLGKDKANLDATVAFVIGLLVVAATKVVAVINEALPQVMVLVIVGLSFLLMMGIFAKPGGTFFDALEGKFRIGIMVVMTIAVILIFLGTIRIDNESWLEYGWNYLIDYWSGAVVGSIILFIVFIAAIFFVVSGGGEKKGKGKE